MTFELVLLILHVLGTGIVIAMVSVMNPPMTKTSLERLESIGWFGMRGSI